MRTLLIIFFFSPAFFSCSNYTVNDTDKIKFDLKEFNDNGLKRLPNGEFASINYEFCIPATEEMFSQVKKIDTTLVYHKLSKGRSRCSNTEWLCIGYSNQPNFKDVMKRLAAQSFIREINETYWE